MEDEYSIWKRTGEGDGEEGGWRDREEDERRDANRTEERLGGTREANRKSYLLIAKRFLSGTLELWNLGKS